MTKNKMQYPPIECNAGGLQRLRLHDVGPQMRVRLWKR